MLIGPAVPEIHSQTDRQTDIHTDGQTDRNTPLPYRGGVIIMIIIIREFVKRAMSVARWVRSMKVTFSGVVGNSITVCFLLR